MVDFHTPEILVGIDQMRGSGPKLVEGGHAAAVCVVDLMQESFDTIQPRDIVDTYLPVKDQTPKQMAQVLWDKFSDDTIQVMTQGSRYLAALWDRA